MHKKPLPELLSKNERLIIMWNATEHSDEDNLRWCWLRAIEWSGWPAFLSQVYAPLLLIFFSWFHVVIAVTIANILWAFLRYRFVSVRLADSAVIVTTLKWFVFLPAAIYLFMHGQKIAAVVALFWPLIAVVLAFIPPPQVGKIQTLFMNKLGYEERLKAEN